MPEPMLTLTIKDKGKLARKFADLTIGPMATLLRQASDHAKNVAGKGIGGFPASESMVSVVGPTSARVHSLMSPARTTSIEEGRPAGGPLLHPNVLSRWIRRVGYPRSGFVLARHIQRRGVKGRFFMRAAIQSTQAVLPTLLNNMGKQIESTFTRRR